jgi:hypothetical protein
VLSGVFQGARCDFRLQRLFVFEPVSLEIGGNLDRSCWIENVKPPQPIVSQIVVQQYLKAGEMRA